MPSRSTIAARHAVTVAMMLLATASTGEEPLTVDLAALSASAASAVAAAAYENCTDRGYKVAVAVVDRGGHLVAFVRNPLAGAHTVDVSRRKAYAAASFLVPTSSIEADNNIRFAENVITLPGGVPIEAGGRYFGAVAVSGASPEVDEACAIEGIDAIREDLEFLD